MQENFWSAVRLMGRREAYAIGYLQRAGFAVYFPRLREHKRRRGRLVEFRPPLFPGYAFVLIVLQWHDARWCPGVIGLCMDGSAPAKVPDKVVNDLKSRERGGLIELPKAPKMRAGDRVRVTSGPFAHHLGLYAGMTAHDRVEVLLTFMGAQTRTELSARAIEAV